MKKLPWLPSELIGWNARYADYKKHGLSMMQSRTKACGRADAVVMFSELVQEARSASTADHDKSSD
jgi:hypothetical protein